MSASNSYEDGLNQLRARRALSLFNDIPLRTRRVLLPYIQYKSKETPQLIGLFSPNLVITNFMQCFLYGPIG